MRRRPEPSGRLWGRALQEGDVIGLSGGLGMGKSVLARAVIRAAMGDPDLEVPSPTFTLVQQYEPDDLSAPMIWHADLYRLDAPGEAVETGLLDAFDEAVVLIEWPERLGPLWPDFGLMITLSAPHSDGQMRVLDFSGPWPERLVKTFL